MVEPIEVADGVHVFVGDTDQVNRENRGMVGNIGFVVGERGTVMINSGGSYRHGLALLDAAERVGGKPVVLVILTQPLQEFVMGAAAFTERGIPLLAHDASANLIEARCAVCLRNLSQLLGEDEMAGTRVVVPTQRLFTTRTLDLGGRSLELMHPGWGSSPGDLLVRDRTSGVVFTGALVSIARIPELRDGNVHGWLGTIEYLESGDTSTMIPGYGQPATTRAAVMSGLAAMRTYLTETEGIVETLFEAGVALSVVIDNATLPAYADWALYAPIHDRNVQHLYLQRERELFDE